MCFSPFHVQLSTGDVISRCGTAELESDILCGCIQEIYKNIKTHRVRVKKERTRINNIRMIVLLF